VLRGYVYGHPASISSLSKSLLSFSIFPFILHTHSFEHWSLGAYTQAQHTSSWPSPTGLFVIHVDVHMGGPVFPVSYPDAADIERAKIELRGYVPTYILPHVQVLHSIPAPYRERFIEAVQSVSRFPADHRARWLSCVSEWEQRGSRGAASISSTSTNDYMSFVTRSSSSFPSASSATSLSSYILSSPPGIESRESSAIAGVDHRARGISYINISHRASPSSHTLPKYSNTIHTHRPPTTKTTTTSTTTTAAAAGGQHAIAPTPVAASYATNYQLYPGQQPAPSLSLAQILGTFPTPKKKIQTKEPAKWKCPVCGTAYTRATEQKKHTQHCISPQVYVCIGCGIKSNTYDVMVEHRKTSKLCLVHEPQVITPPARNKHASSLTGKLFNTEGELMDDADQYCRSFKNKSIPTSCQTIRLRALLDVANIEEVNQELEKQCYAAAKDSGLWRVMRWDDASAYRFSSMAEFGLQDVPISNDSRNAGNSIQIPGYGLEQHGLGIEDIRQFVTDVLRASDYGFLFDPQLHSSDPHYDVPSSSGLPVAQSAATITPEEGRANSSNWDHPDHSLSNGFVGQGLTDVQPDDQRQPNSHMQWFDPDTQRPLSVHMQGYNDEPAQQDHSYPGDTYGAGPSMEQCGIAL
jgi:hypothetical protein